MLKKHAEHPEQQDIINFYSDKFGIEKERQLELIAHSSVEVQNALEGKYTTLYEPLEDLIKVCENKQEATMLIYNFGRAIGSIYDGNTFRERNKEDHES
jgi:glutamine phosphoribosylpyrophosphate amidotransferase